MHDKDVRIVKRAMDGLAWAFCKRVATKWAEGEDEDWCLWIPDAILLSSACTHTAEGEWGAESQIDVNNRDTRPRLHTVDAARPGRLW